ncbi:FRG domain-containing protein [Aliiroseovarius sp. N1F302]|nr:FRG domain-containing protein [Aliiroseovarius sediminis]MCI2393816.1 FRG domain-containing protein [Aliiroseovarius sediminis]
MDVSEWENGWQLWDLISHLKDSAVVGPTNLYRGQSDAEWGLTPALYRREVHIFSEQLSKAELYLRAEEAMLRAFFDQGALLLPDFQRAPFIDRFVAQHYGVPTQLLDWTLDPLIALFFAVSGDPEKDCALFYMQPLSRVWSDRTNIKLPWDGKIAALKPPVLDDRIRTQKSFFTVQSFQGADTFLPLDQRALKVSKKNEGTHPNDEVSTFGKVIVPARRKQQVLFQLLQLGIDSSLVYPGLQGIGQRIADIANIQKYGGRDIY